MHLHDCLRRIHGGGSDELGRQREPAARHQNDLAALRHVVQELRRECGGQPIVLGDEVELVIAEQARDVEVARSDPRPFVIGEQRLSVQHRPAILEDAGAGMQQLAVPAAREDADNRDVGGAGEQQSHIHAAARRIDKGCIERRRRHEIRIRDPQPFRHRRGEQLHRAIDPRLTRQAFHDAHGGRTAFVGLGRRLVVGQWAAGARPHPAERRIERRNRRSAHDHHGIAPAGLSRPRVAGPFVADAETTRHRALTIDDEQLAVIAAERLDRTARPDRLEGAAVHAVTAQLAPEPAARAAAAERIVEDSDADAGAGPLRPCACEAAAGLVVVNDVILEMHRALRARDHLEHRIERMVADRDVPEDVARNRPRTCRAVQRPRERVRRRNGGGHPPRPSEGSTGRSA